MDKHVFLITGVNGEIGHSLIAYLRQKYPDSEIIAFDIADIDKSLLKYEPHFYNGNVLDQQLIERIFDRNDIDCIFHLASLLSTRAEKVPEFAHEVNVSGSLNILHAAARTSERLGKRVKVIFPSSIAVYGLPDLEEKHRAGHVKENQHLNPITMYGCNKLTVENLGEYYSRYYKLTERTGGIPMMPDFRCVRFPGLISAITMPTGGTSDYGPEMLHYAARGEHYDCFVRPDSRISFMAMPDAIKSLIGIAEADQAVLRQSVYNVTSFSLTASEFLEIVRESFPKADIGFAVNPCRQMIIDSWPEDTDDSAARKDWGWAPDYDCKKAFEEYLVPAIKERYGIN